YKDDPYDRVWAPAVRKHGLIDVASDAPHIRTGILDRPPYAVLQNAMTAVNPSDRIKFRLQFPPVNFNIYLSMYFSEVAMLNTTTEKRSFQLLIDDEPVLDSPIVPPYGSCLEVYDSNITVFSNITFALAPMEESTLPPIINAMEIFLIGDLLEDGTDSKDVEGLLILQSAFGVLQDWSGDPCLPKPYSWEWIECNSDPRPRVTALYLSSFDLTGVVPDFSTMDALETIDFHNNTLKGPIPEFLATLPNLKQLNLAINEFSGPVPDSLSKKIGLNLVVTGNPDLCTSGNSCKTYTSSSLTE
ncbi:PREDICTED: putative leucine-rich repeat receptor-like protein kinase At2g19210, partial [Erythranthe guttata]